MAYVAVVYGGFSGEAKISEKSANEILKAFQSTLSEPVLVRIVDANWTAEFKGHEYPIRLIF